MSHQSPVDTHQPFLSFNSGKKKSLSSSSKTFVTFWEDHLRTFLQLVLASTYKMTSLSRISHTGVMQARTYKKCPTHGFPKKNKTTSSSCNHKTAENFDPCLCNKCNYFRTHQTFKGHFQSFTGKDFLGYDKMFLWKKLDFILLDTWLVRPSNQHLLTNLTLHIKEMSKTFLVPSPRAGSKQTWQKRWKWIKLKSPKKLLGRRWWL